MRIRQRSCKTTVVILLTVVIVSVSSCKKKEVISQNWTGSTFEEATYRLVQKKDTLAYGPLHQMYLDSPNPRFLYYALYAANRYGCASAYADVYYCLTDRFSKEENTELDSLDERTRSLAIDYLKFAAEAGDSDCQNRLGELYLEGRYLDRDSLKGEEWIKRSER